jgi:hypothetical protein
MAVVNWQLACNETATVVRTASASFSMIDR